MRDADKESPRARNVNWEGFFDARASVLVCRPASLALAVYNRHGVPIQYILNYPDYLPTWIIVPGGILFSDMRNFQNLRINWRQYVGSLYHLHQPERSTGHLS
jgi:hypothetical protein